MNRTAVHAFAQVPSLMQGGKYYDDAATQSKAFFPKGMGREMQKRRGIEKYRTWLEFHNRSVWFK